MLILVFLVTGVMSDDECDYIANLHRSPSIVSDVSCVLVKNAVFEDIILSEAHSSGAAIHVTEIKHANIRDSFFVTCVVDSEVADGRGGAIFLESLTVSECYLQLTRCCAQHCAAAYGSFLSLHRRQWLGGTFSVSWSTMVSCAPDSASDRILTGAIDITTTDANPMTHLNWTDCHSLWDNGVAALHLQSGSDPLMLWQFWTLMDCNGSSILFQSRLNAAKLEYGSFFNNTVSTAVVLSLSYGWDLTFCVFLGNGNPFALTSGRAKPYKLVACYFDTTVSTGLLDGGQEYWTETLTDTFAFCQVNTGLCEAVVTNCPTQPFTDSDTFLAPTRRFTSSLGLPDDSGGSDPIDEPKGFQMWIIGVIIGAVVLVAVIAGAAVFVMRKRADDGRESPDTDEPSDEMTEPPAPEIIKSSQFVTCQDHIFENPVYDQPEDEANLEFEPQDIDETLLHN
jgi:hypothetical protein